MSAFKVTKELASKVLETVDAGLVCGVGDPIPGKMCVEAAVCYAMGLPHGDEPTCVSPAVRRLKIVLNDSKRWQNDMDRARGMRRLAIAQLGTAGVINDVEFTKAVAEFTIRTVIPFALRATGIASLEGYAIACEIGGTMEEAKNARHAAIAANAVAYAANAVAYAADAAAYAAADAADAAAYAANAVAYAADAAAYAAADAAAYAAKSNTILHIFAEGVTQILIKMNAPGAAFLDLAPLSTEVK